MKTNNKGNFILILFTAIIITVLLEFLSGIVIKHYSKKYIINKEISDFYLKYSNQTNHLRTLNYILDDNSNIIKDKKLYGRNFTINDLIFSNFEPLQKNKETILIQGDSWVEILIDYKEEYLKVFDHIKENLNIVISGTSSFSPSLSQAQFQIITGDFDLNPNYVVLIVEQSDIGDEICRYKKLRDFDMNSGKVKVGYFDDHKGFSGNEVYSFLGHIRYSNVLQSKSWNLIKLIKLVVLRSRLHIVTYLTDACSWKDISKYLFNKLSDEEKNYFTKTLKNYIDYISKNNSFKKLYIVTHYHKNHLSNEYQTNVSDLVDEVIRNNYLESNISHLKFKPENHSEEVKFEKNDPSSHLTMESHANYYFDHILRKVKTDID